MPELNARELGLGGQGDLSMMASALDPQWFDCDRARVVEGNVLRAWPGWIRRGMALAKAAHFGAASGKIQIVGASEQVIRKRTGHLLAAVDRQSNTDGRVLGLAHHQTGTLGTQLVGRPKQTTGSGLDDLETQGIYTGDSAALYVIEIDAAAGTDTFKWSNDGGATFEATGVAMTGEWQTLENGIEVKFAATTGHTLADAWHFGAGGRPMLLAELNRVTAHDYISFAGTLGKLCIYTPWDEVHVDDGQEVRVAGIQGPLIKPRTTTEVLEDGLTDIGDTDGDPVSWASKNEAAVTRETTVKVGDTSSVKIVVPEAIARKDNKPVAYRNVSGTISTGNRLRFWIRPAFDNDKRLKEKRIAVVFHSEFALGGTRKRLRMNDIKLQGDTWYQVDLAWTDDDFTFASVGFEIDNVIGRSKIVSDQFTFYFEDMSIEDADDQDTVETFNDPGDYRFRFSWYRRDRAQESPLSPISDGLDADGKKIALDLSGWYPDIPEGLANAVPDGVDAYHLYVTHPTFDVDPRLGGSAFYRLTPDEGYPVTDAQTPAGYSSYGAGSNTGDGTMSEPWVAEEAPAETWTITFTSATAFTVAGSATGATDNGETGETYDNGFVRFEITVGATPFVAGDSFTIVVALTADEDGKLPLTLSNEIDIDKITAQRRDPFFIGRPQPGKLAVVDGDVIVTAGQPTYSVGEWTFTDGSQVVTPVTGDGVGDTPVVGRWMEGRTIRRDGDTQTYRILKAMDTDDDGALDALFIAAQFDPDEQTHIGGYEGTTGDGRAFIVGDTSSIWWTNKTNERGVDPESASVLNTLRVMPAGESIMGGGKVDEWLWLLGSNNTYVLRQDTAALSDLPANGVAYQTPIHLPGIGLMGRRCWTPTPSGKAMFVTPRGEIMEASGNGAQRHPASDALASVLSGYGYLASSKMLRNSFVEHIANGAEEYLYLGLIGGGQGDVYGQPGVRNQATDHYRDADVGAGEPEDVFSLPIIWDDGDDANNYWSYLFRPMAEEEAFNPYGTPAYANPEDGGGYNGPATDDWGRDWNLERWFTETNIAFPNYARCTCSWATSAPTENPAKTLNNGSKDTSWHNNIVYGGDARGYFAFKFYKANQPVVDLTHEGHFAYMVNSSYNGNNRPILTDHYSKLKFRVYYDGPSGAVIPAGTFVLGFGSGLAYDASKQVPIQQAITAGQWNDIEIPIAAFGAKDNDAEILTSEDETDYIRIGNWHLHLSTAMTDAMFRTSDDEMDLYISGGHWITDEEATDAPIEPLDFGQYCDEPGAQIDTDAPASDFLLGVLVDLRRSLVYMGSECRWTCAGVSPASGCASPVMATEAHFFGSKDGFIDLVFDEKILTWGSPSNRFVFSVASSTATTATIDRSFGGQSNQLSLSLDDDDAGILAGLCVAKVPSSESGTIEYRRITANTVDTLTVSIDWTSNPASGDLLVIGPLPWMVHFAEQRWARSALLRSFGADFERANVPTVAGCSDTFQPRMTLEVFGANGDNRRIEDLVADASRRFDGSELTGGVGRVRMPAKASKALSYRLTVLQGQQGPALLRNPNVEERIR